ncbi:MAG TPA: hypothetical protein PLD59_10675 [Tepidisphaeraceae bacterium]|nr:hypothetical protein [Tepidisphaeraceae bacterium]
MEQVLTIDPVNFIKRFSLNAVNTVNIFQSNGGFSEFRYWHESSPSNYAVTQGEFSNFFVRQIKGSVVAGAWNVLLRIEENALGLFYPPNSRDYVAVDPIVARFSDPFRANHLTAPWVAQDYYFDW